MTRPACMDADEYLAWQEANRTTRGPERADSPCRDCTPLWHADMLDGGMCDGTPGGSRPPGRSLAPTELRHLSYAELRAVRLSLPKYGPPAELVTAMKRARWREYQRRRRDFRSSTTECSVTGCSAS